MTVTDTNELTPFDQAQAIKTVQNMMLPYFLKHDKIRSRPLDGEKSAFKIDQIGVDENGRPRVIVIINGFQNRGKGPQVEVHASVTRSDNLLADNPWFVDGHLAFVCDTKEMLWDELQGLSTDETGAEASQEAAAGALA